MWDIFGKPLKRAIWNTLGLHALLTTCLRFSSVLGDACVGLEMCRNGWVVPISLHPAIWTTCRTLFGSETK